MVLLDVKNLNRSFGGLRAIREVSFSLEAGLIKAVIGPNGAGKTTLFNLLTGNLAADNGTLLFDHQDLSGKPAFLRARAGMARTFQNIKLFPQMSVLDNVLVGGHTRTRSGFLSGMLPLPGSVREQKSLCEQAMVLLHRYGLADEKNTLTGALSFGQQRSVELCRALLLKPKLLLLDEPAAGLNMQETAMLSESIRYIRSERITVLLVEHDMSLVMDICDEILVLNYGERIAEGKPTDIRRNPDVIKIYLGDEDA
ncbi:MAG: hypothetical protein A2293_02660 [Elusimicrobia bacterium RIFOXYB2_FULL_49_7]|nr:MAG: hypothetical protein A2293_02660 [Elusimicrobia bacterium RIFOXYB2_FULL_49_7]